MLILRELFIFVKGSVLLMGLPTYVINFDELVQMIAIEGATVELDTTEIERILNRYFPELIDILNKLA